MSQFEHIEPLINHYLDLTNEINAFIEKEEYEDAISLTEKRSGLVKKLFHAITSINLSEEENQKVSNFKNKISEDDKHLISSLKVLKEKISEELKGNKKKFKLTSAYAMPTRKRQGVMINVSE